MKKQTINLSWPVVLSDFTQENKNEMFTRGKLNVYYEGETADKRCFSEKMSKELVKTLPFTPVVSYYDEDQEDFVGHARQQQIYGIVDPCVEPEFKVLEDGKNWCICDVILYTERPDKVGEIASKIIGQPHSLELDPKTVEYVINYDEKKHFKNIEFTAGKFVGVSVLGKNQKPAFTGSGFFSCDADFEAKMQILRDYCTQTNEAEKQDGGEAMNLQEFMTLSWGEVSNKVDAQITKEYQNDAYTYIVDMYEDCAIVRFHYYMEQCSKLMKIYYTCDEEGNVTLGDVKEVHVVYEEVEQKTTEVEINMKQIEETSIDAVNLSDQDDENKTETEVEEETIEDKKDEKDDDNEEKDDKEDFVEPTIEPVVEENVVVVDDVTAQVSNVEITPTQMEASVENENTNNEETASSATSLTEGERAEFEALKREKKVNLLNSYKDSLTEEEYNNFLEGIDSFSDESLELELLKAYKRNQQVNTNSDKPIRAFAFAPINNANNESPLDAFVSKYKK